MRALVPEELSVEQKIGQLLVARCYVDEDDRKFIIDMVKKKCVGGVQMCFGEEQKSLVFLCTVTYNVWDVWAFIESESRKE